MLIIVEGSQLSPSYIVVGVVAGSTAQTVYSNRNSPGSEMWTMSRTHHGFLTTRKATRARISFVGYPLCPSHDP